jgi:Tfp pilus assembly protein PilF
MGIRCLAIFVVLVWLAGCGDSTTDQARLERIATQYELGNTAAAIKDLNDYLGAYPRDDLAWTILGNAYKDIERLDEAQAAYEKALAVNPRRFEALTGKGILHRKRGEYAQAMSAYEIALAIDASYAQAYSSMTVIALKSHEDSQALEYAKRGYDLDETDPVIAANLAVAYHYNDDVENRDRFTRVAEKLGYPKIDILQRIYSGEMTVRD